MYTTPKFPPFKMCEYIHSSKWTLGKRIQNLFWRNSFIYNEIVDLYVYFMTQIYREKVWEVCHHSPVTKKTTEQNRDANKILYKIFCGSSIRSILEGLCKVKSRTILYKFCLI